MTSTRNTGTANIARAFERARAESRPALMPFMTLGWPEADDTERLIPALVQGGADLIELGMPFSDPIADGPTVQRTSQRALLNGVTVASSLGTVRRMRAAGVQVPLLFMTYYNPIFYYGLKAFARDAADAGIDGLIVPDLPPEESDELLAACRANGLALIYFIAPTSTDERIAAVVERAEGFIYLIALTGVTGARSELAEGLGDYVAHVRRHTSLPLALGFGISTRAHVEAAAEHVDGVICASAMLDQLERAEPEALVQTATDFVRQLRGG